MSYHPTKPTLALRLTLACLLLAGCGHAVAPQHIDAEWKDAARNRILPVRLYLPRTTQAAPVIIFSPGLGGTRSGYAFLLDYWAQRGYLCVCIQHPGSDSAAVLEKGWGYDQIMQCMRKAIDEPANYVNRPRDVSFIIDRLQQENAAGTLTGRLDLQRIGLAGHSFGAYTVLAAAGHRFTHPNGQQVDFPEPRLRAAIALSERPNYTEDPEQEFGRIRIPMLHMAGTHDVSPFGDVAPADRRNVFDRVPPRADQYLVILDNAIHKTFAGDVLPGKPVTSQDRQRFELVRRATTRFWDAYLRGDAAAKKLLREKGFRPLLRREDVTEKHLAPSD